MKHRYRDLLLADTAPLQFIVFLLGLLFSVGMMVSGGKSGAYAMMLDVMSHLKWAALLLMYAAAHGVYIFVWPCKPMLAATSFAGMVFWAFVLSSFLFNRVRIFGAADVMVVVPFLMEIWILASALSALKDANDQ